jgi:hypothetical protein
LNGFVARRIVLCFFVVGLVACSDSGNATPSPDAKVSTPDAGPPDARLFPDAPTDRSACVPDESGPVHADRCGVGSAPACGTWIKVDVAGAVCSDGSQYKIFVNYSSTSDNLEVMFEPGGACWDYPSCSGNGGIRGAANPHGIPDDHMTFLQFLNLLLRTDDNPAKDYNMVFIPYCTGDVHTGNKVAMYDNPDPNHDPDAGTITFRHVGHDNVMKAIAWMHGAFPTMPRLFVTGCSAGGIGALQNYFYVRQGMTGAQCGYLLDDSGPAFHSDGPSRQLHAKIRDAWNLDPLLDALDGQVDVDIAALKADFGLINTAIADKFPHDRLSLTLYRMDLNYSLYSYQRFFPDHNTDQDIHNYWWQDIQELIATFDTRSNWAYFIPNFRFDNCSHCVSIPPLGHDITTQLTMPWLGSSIERDGLDLKQFVIDLLDQTKPLHNYVEDSIPSEQFTTDQLAQCLAGG